MSDLISRRGQPRRLLFAFLIACSGSVAADIDDCRDIANAAERLQCYDAVETYGDSISIQDEQQPEVPQRRYSVWPDSREIGPAVEVEATVVKIDRTVYDKLVLTLASGEVWQQIDSEPLRFEVGEAVFIIPAVSKSYLLQKQTGSRQIRVRRIN